jgi:hypothetical protein
MPSATATAIIEAAPAREQQVATTWSALSAAESRMRLSVEQRRERGIEFGAACYKLRAQSEVVSGGTTFNATLDKLGIPHRSAYRWIARYEVKAGLRVVTPIVEPGPEVEPTPAGPAPENTPPVWQKAKPKPTPLVEPAYVEPATVEPAYVPPATDQSGRRNGKKDWEYFCRAGDAINSSFNQAKNYVEPIIAMPTPSDPETFMMTVEAIEKLIATLDVATDKIQNYRRGLEETLRRFALEIEKRAKVEPAPATPDAQAESAFVVPDEVEPAEVEQ